MQGRKSRRRCSRYECFNPHPARRPDASTTDRFGSSRWRTFQSSSSPKTGCKARRYGYDPLEQLDVSILIQPEDRMQAGTSCTTRQPELFQSSSSPKTGCKASLHCLVNGTVLVSILIQPEDRMQGRLKQSIQTFFPVSILIQPEDRMQADRGGPTASVSLFQSSSSPKTGCKPAFSATSIARSVDVSILIQPEDRMQGVGQRGRRLAVQVSILIQPEDRMQGR